MNERANGLKSFRTKSWVVSDPAKPQASWMPTQWAVVGDEPEEVKSSMLLQRSGGSIPWGLPRLLSPGHAPCLKRAEMMAVMGYGALSVRCSPAHILHEVENLITSFLWASVLLSLSRDIIVIFIS